MRKQISLIFLLILFFQFSSIAQVTDKPLILSDSAQEEFRQRTIIKVKEFQKLLSLMTSKKLQVFEKKTYIGVAADLFIRRGDSVWMEISYKVPGKDTIVKKLRPLLIYFNNLCELTKGDYVKIVIKASQAVRVENFRLRGRDANGYPVYVGTATYFQQFIGYRGDGTKYEDISKKNMEVEIHWTIDLEGERYAVFLGDISVEETK